MRKVRFKEVKQCTQVIQEVNGEVRYQIQRELNPKLTHDFSTVLYQKYILYHSAPFLLLLVTHILEVIRTVILFNLPPLKELNTGIASFR